MPLRAFPYSLLLIAAVASLPAQGADWMGWMTRAEVLELPEELQRPVPEWCPGIYYHPELAHADPEGDTLVSADRSRVDREQRVMLEGALEIELPDLHMRAERGWLHQDSGDYALDGNILVRGRDFSMRASRLHGNLDRREGLFENVEYTLHAMQARGDAEQIEHDPASARIGRGTYTTCAPGQRGWEIEAGDIQLDGETGWGEARNMTLRVRDRPVLWLPWITFPIDDRRKTGLLFPTIGTADERGLDITQPLYLNIHPQLDATLAARYIHDRGAGMENELRYLVGAGEGRFSHAWLYSDDQFDNEDRELAAWEHDGRVGDWDLESEMTWVSDDFYFEDLDTGLEVRSRTHLPRTGQARYRGDTWDFRARAQAWQTLDEDITSPYRRLPQLHLVGDPALYGPARLLWDGEFTRFGRTGVEPEDDVEGDRLHLEPAITMPMRRSWGYVEPRVRLYHTRYDLQGEAPRPEDRPERTLLGASLDAGIFLQRPLFGQHSDMVQTLEPRIFYNYIEFEDQAELPDFDAGELTSSSFNLFEENRFTGFDRIGDEDRITLGLTSRILDPAAGGEQLRLGLTQAWHRRDRKVQLDAADPDTRPRSPLVSEATWFPARNWLLFAENQWDSVEDRTDRNTLRLGYAPGPRRALHLGYQSRRADDVEQGELAGSWPVHANWSLLGRWLYDLERERTVEALGGVEYRDCCWQVRLVGLRERSRRETMEADNRYFLEVRMLGLGALGRGLDSLLERSIPGLKQ